MTPNQRTKLHDLIKDHGAIISVVVSVELNTTEGRARKEEK